MSGPAFLGGDKQSNLLPVTWSLEDLPGGLAPGESAPLASSICLACPVQTSAVNQQV